MINLLSIITVLTAVGVIYLINPFTKVSERNHYYGSNNNYRVSLTRFIDYNSFLKAKDSSIWVYDTEENFNDNTGYIVGEIQIMDSEEKSSGNIELFQSCKVELIRKSGWNTSSSTMNFEEPKNGVTRFPFIAYDFSDSENNIYKEAILRIGKSEIPIELKSMD